MSIHLLDLTSSLLSRMRSYTSLDKNLGLAVFEYRPRRFHLLGEFSWDYSWGVYCNLRRVQTRLVQLYMTVFRRFASFDFDRHHGKVNSVICEPRLSRVLVVRAVHGR